MVGTEKENLATVFECIQYWYQLSEVPLRHRYPSMKITQYKGGDVGHLPKLKGTGMQCRWLAVVMPDVFENFMDVDDHNQGSEPDPLRQQAGIPIPARGLRQAY